MAAGYLAHRFRLGPRLLGQPQSRPRLWIVAMQLGNHTGGESDACLLTGTMERLVELSPLDLLVEADA